MALSIPTYTFVSTGLTLTNAYATLGSSHGDLITFNFDIFFYVSQELFSSGAHPVFSKSYSVPTADVTGVAGLYTYLQTLPEYSGSTLVD